MELLGIEEDEEVKGSWGGERKDALEELIIEVDDAAIGGLGLEGLELGD